MKFNSLLYAACILMLSLGAKAELIVSTDDYVTFQWEAVCGDCQSDKGVFSEEFSVGVTGNIVISGYTLGQAFTFDESNIVSFQYEGPSNHVDKLVLHNANFDLSDQWMDLSDANESGTYSPTSIIDGRTHFAENMTVNSGWIADDLSSYILDFTFDTFVPVDEYGELIPFSKLSNYSSGEFTINKEVFNIYYESNGDWGINISGVSSDLGRGARITLPTTEVPEPSTLAIFALGLMGLASRRFKKQA